MTNDSMWHSSQWQLIQCNTHQNDNWFSATLITTTTDSVQHSYDDKWFSATLITMTTDSVQHSSRRQLIQCNNHHTWFSVVQSGCASSVFLRGTAAPVARLLQSGRVRPAADVWCNPTRHRFIHVTYTTALLRLVTPSHNNLVMYANTTPLFTNHYHM